MDENDPIAVKKNQNPRHEPKNKKKIIIKNKIYDKNEPKYFNCKIKQNVFFFE